MMKFLKRMFGQTESKEIPPETRLVFDKIRGFLSDESAQNEMYAPEATRAGEGRLAQPVSPGAIPLGTGLRAGRPSDSIFSKEPHAQPSNLLVATCR
jgi:hypothetical protein